MTNMTVRIVEPGSGYTVIPISEFRFIGGEKPSALQANQPEDEAENPFAAQPGVHLIGCDGKRFFYPFATDPSERREFFVMNEQGATVAAESC